MKNKKFFTPMQVARILKENFSHKVTSSVIRKWDALFFSTGARGRGVARQYDEGDISVFNMIAVLRGLGFDLKEIREILEDYNASGDKSRYLKEISDRMSKQRRAILEARKFFIPD